MGTPNTQLRVTADANDALKRVVAQYGRFSLAQLADALIVESCRAILSDGTPEFPTINYIRHQIQLERISTAAAAVAQGGARKKPASYLLNESADSDRTAEEPDEKKKAAHTKRAA